MGIRLSGIMQVLKIFLTHHKLCMLLMVLAMVLIYSMQINFDQLFRFVCILHTHTPTHTHTHLDLLTDAQNTAAVVDAASSVGVDPTYQALAVETAVGCRRQRET